MSLINEVGENKIPLKKFFRFLKDEAVYSLYLSKLKNNKDPYNSFNSVYKHDIKYFFSECEPEYWATECFCWAGQREGRYFWECIHKKWVAFCRSKKKMNYIPVEIKPCFK